MITWRDDMELGAKIRQARLEAGLSQRQLCGDTITRNMLSQIENGTAKPSMATLQILAERLGKSVGYFLGEKTVSSPNPEVMRRAREAYGQKKCEDVLRILQEYQEPDPLFDEEQRYLFALAALSHSEVLLIQGDAQRAAALLEQIHRATIYYTQTMERQRRVLLVRAYQELERFYQTKEDYKQAYFYACKLRNLHG